MEITAALVKKLRESDGRGNDGVQGRAHRSQGGPRRSHDHSPQARSGAGGKKAGRSTNEGLIGSYIHMGGKIGVLVEINCESDFVARTDDFQGLAREIAMHIAAANPTYVRREESPPTCSSASATSIARRWKDQNKPAQVIDKIVDGKLNSFYEQVCLLDQPSIRDPKITIGQLVQAAIAKLGENIAVATLRSVQARGEAGCVQGSALDVQP